MSIQDAGDAIGATVCICVMVVVVVATAVMGFAVLRRDKSDETTGGE